MGQSGVQIFFFNSNQIYKNIYFKGDQCKFSYLMSEKVQTPISSQPLPSRESVLKMKTLKLILDANEDVQSTLSLPGHDFSGWVLS